jgi:hypothetical protein
MDIHKERLLTYSNFKKNYEEGKTGETNWGDLTVTV